MQREIRQHRRQVILAVKRGNAQADDVVLPGGQAGNALLQVLALPQQLAPLAHQQLARGRQAHGVRIAHEKLRAERFFRPADRLRKRGLADE